MNKLLKEILNNSNGCETDESIAIFNKEFTCSNCIHRLKNSSCPKLEEVLGVKSQMLVYDKFACNNFEATPVKKACDVSNDRLIEVVSKNSIVMMSLLTGENFTYDEIIEELVKRLKDK